VTETTSLAPSAPAWERAVVFPPGSLDDAARVFRFIHENPGRDGEEIANALGLDHLLTHQITWALGEMGVVGEA